MKYHTPILLILCCLGIAVILAACGQQATPIIEQPTPCPACPEPDICPEPVVCPECPDAEPCPSSVEAPFEAMWMTSAHADASAEAFVHWDEDDPAVVPATCAKCHSTYGYQDFLGADGTAAGSVDNDAAIGSVITCVACHNEATLKMTSVIFPSGAEITDLGPEARCMQCHQGRASTANVDSGIEEAGLTDMDTPSEELGFINIHYFAAAATQFGTQAMGGYQYASKLYDAKFAHVADMDTCVDCHNPHTLEVQVETCSDCHTGVASVDDLKNIRTVASKSDYDGDGDTDEGVFYEIEGLQAMLMEAIQTYAQDVVKTAIGYNSHAYPYFFMDGDANGEIDEEEAVFGNAYSSWTGRLAKAAYNYQTSLKDPGAFAHGGKYIIELLYDSIDDLNTVLDNPVSLETARRIDAGHFASSQEAFRHWDEDGEVRASCAKCHSDSGLPTFLKEGVNVSAELSSGFRCTTCHSSETYERYVVEEVKFPSGAVLTTDSPDANLCLNCHQGRSSGVSVENATAGLEPDTVSENLRFINVHYYAAGATLFGSESQG
ncbi:MAG: cytochrome c3 family protein, partial [Anaerolineae bacterium]|nr:cytochrome c3 family protein [Anaerolineae bacterium]